MVAKVGDTLPDVKLYEYDEDTQVALRDLFQGKKGVIFGLPGAYTPVCSASHLPEFIEETEKLRSAGAEVIACTSTDRPYCLAAWGNANGADGKVRFLADPQGILARALGVETNVPHLGLVSKRYSAVISDNAIKNFNLEQDPAGTGLACSRAINTVDHIRIMVAKIGDTLPDVKVFEGTPDNEFPLHDVFKGKKGVLFAVPGAFTPGCSKTHLPGYVDDYDKFTAAGAEVIACTSTDNAFALTEWGKVHKADGKIRLLADPQGKLAKALGVNLDLPPLGLASKRYSAVINDNVIKTFNVESEGGGTGLACSLANNTLGQLKNA